MRISVIVPVFNEEETVAQVLESLAQVPLDLEVVVIDDASTDRTWDILQELRAKEPFSSYLFLRHDHNQGKGAGLRAGFGMATGDLVTIQDADMEYDPQDIPALVKKWESAGNSKAAVYGYRNFSGQKLTTQWGNRFLTLVTNVLFGARIHDMETCYKLLPGELARALPMQGRRFEIEPEITACTLMADYKILEVPIGYKPRKEKKLNPWKDGWPALAMLLRLRFGKPFRVVGSTPSPVSQPAGTTVAQKEAADVSTR